MGQRDTTVAGQTPRTDTNQLAAPAADTTTQPAGTGLSTGAPLLKLAVPAPTAAVVGTPTVSAAAAPPTAAGIAAPPTTTSPVVADLLQLVGLSPTASPGLPAPIDPPIGWMVLGAVRRWGQQLLSAADDALALQAPTGPVAAGVENGFTGGLSLTGIANVLVGGAPTANPSQLAENTAPAMAIAVQSPNLLVNPGAELGDPSLSGYSSVTVPGWTVTGTPTVIDYGTMRRLPFPFATPGPTLPASLGFPSHSAGGGRQFFGGGPVGTSTLSQFVDLSGAASQIDTGTVPYTLSGDLGGFTIDPSAASVTVVFLGANNQKLGAGEIGPVTALDRGFQTGLLTRQTSGTVPVGTRSAQVVVTFTDSNPVAGNYNNAYADNLSFTVGAALPPPPPPKPPASTVGQLDHVFIIYMENKGATDIVGSPNAPYINSLINTYGYASNYYALTHPSDPNYTPILGGSDFGLNYNCAANCYNEPNLADNIEAAGKTWAGYAQGGGGYASPTDQLPFLAFSDIYSNPARVQAHLFPLSQLPLDLGQANTPNFVWIAANDANNMEGPTSGFGIVLWALSQLGDHQYNVKAGDTFLQDTLPIILNSPVWQDPTQRSAIFITWDEDYNNLSLGIDNQGNHVSMIVIPSPGAVASGMRRGSFVATDYYNHYSLLRTIEDALGLSPLTNNDKYAQPMNEFWA